MWLFLVTEVLFFRGMFCAYALYRSLHPAVFEFSSQFLNEKLGAFNTGCCCSAVSAWLGAFAVPSCGNARIGRLCLAITLGWCFDLPGRQSDRVFAQVGYWSAAGRSVSTAGSSHGRAP